jgi:cob(I)alamin adenosyltransferase
MPSRIYTRTGDGGETGLFGGQRVQKDDVRVEAYGAVDELNAVIGVAAAHCADPALHSLLLSLQADLFQLGADLATPPEEKTQRGRVSIRRMDSTNVERLEAEIDRWESELTPLQTFILPGGHAAAAALHQARAVCRRAERRTVTLRRSASGAAEQSANDPALTYLNRLSDLLFVLSRAANRRHGVTDIPWTP